MVCTASAQTFMHPCFNLLCPDVSSSVIQNSRAEEFQYSQHRGSVEEAGRLDGCAELHLQDMNFCFPERSCDKGFTVLQQR